MDLCEVWFSTVINAVKSKAVTAFRFAAILIAIKENYWNVVLKVLCPVVILLSHPLYENASNIILVFNMLKKIVTDKKRTFVVGKPAALNAYL